MRADGSGAAARGIAEGTRDLKRRFEKTKADSRRPAVRASLSSRKGARAPAREFDGSGECTLMRLNLNYY